MRNEKNNRTQFPNQKQCINNASDRIDLFKIWSTHYVRYNHTWAVFWTKQKNKTKYKELVMQLGAQCAKLCH